MVVETDLLTTPFTKLVGCKVPIQQAGMGPLANPKLVSAVTNAGALGMLSGMVIDSVDLLERVLREVKDSTTGPFGVNYIVPLMERGELEQMVPVAARYARVVEFFYGVAGRVACSNGPSGKNTCLVAGWVKGRSKSSGGHWLRPDCSTRDRGGRSNSGTDKPSGLS